MANLSLLEKAERAARKRTQRDISRWPLLELSGELHHWTAEEIQGGWDRYAAKLEESEAHLFAREYRFENVLLVS